LCVCLFTEVLNGQKTPAQIGAPHARGFFSVYVLPSVARVVLKIPMREKYNGPPMDLANMGQNGVCSLSADCLDCHHEAVVNVDQYPGHLTVPSFSGRMRCSKCGSKKVRAIPAWSTRLNPILHPR
jgi:hypothetical protein